MKKFLVAIHEYLSSINQSIKTRNDDLGEKLVKTLIIEIVRLKQDKIWNYYSAIEKHPQKDIRIKKWIGIILNIELKFITIVKDLKSENLYDQGI